MACTGRAIGFWMFCQEKLLIIGTASILSWLSLPAVAQNGPYTLTIFADKGAGGSTSAPHGTSGSGPNFGHMFIELANGDRQIFIGYYGYGPSGSISGGMIGGALVAKGQLRPDTDLFRNGEYDVSKTYQITETGYINAHKVIDDWGGPNGKKWGLTCNCADFVQTIALSAGVNLTNVPTDLGINMPKLWAQYLQAHGGTVNNRKPVMTSAVSGGDSGGIVGTWEASMCGFSQAFILIVSKDSSGSLAGTLSVKNIITAAGGGPCDMAKWDGKVLQGIFHNAVFAGNHLSFSTVVEGTSMNVLMTLAGNGLIWTDPAGDRVVLNKVR